MAKGSQPKSSGSAPPAAGTASRFPWQKALAIVEPLSVAILFAYLLKKSWMRWPDPLIDFPRDLYTAWRLSEGDVLYTQVVSWYGPLPHLLQGAAFKLFGVGLDTMVRTNLVLTIAVLLLLRALFFDLGGRLSAWLCSVVFLSVFAFGHLVGIGNYNFITPYAAQATYGFAGLLLVLWGLERHLRNGGRRWLLVAGAGLGCAYLCKPEPVLAAAGSLVVYFAARWLRDVRDPEAGLKAATLRFLRGSAWVFGGFFCLWVPVFLVLAIKGGASYALMHVNWVPYTVLSSKFRNTGLSSTFNQWTIGTDHPQENYHTQLLAAIRVALPCLALVAAAWAWKKTKLRSPAWWVSLAAVIGLGVFFTVWAWHLTWTPAPPPAPGEWHFTWRDIGRALVFTSFVAAALAVLWSFVAAWLRRESFRVAVPVAVLGVAGALMLVRMVLNGRLGHYGFFMAPLATFFFINLAVGTVPRLLAAQGRANWPLQIAFALLVLSGAKSLADVSLAMYELKTFPVSEGRDRFYTFDPQVGMTTGPMLNNMLTLVREAKRQSSSQPLDSLLAIPESAAVNYHARLRNPIPEMEFQPTTLAFVGIDQVLADLKAHPPSLILLYPRDLGEYGVKRHYFESPETGLAILDWIRSNYGLAYPAPNTPASALVTPLTPTGHYLDLLVINPAAPAAHP